MDMPGLSLNLTGLSNLGKDKRPSPAETYDLLIVGGGPASMSAAVYAARKLLKFAILTKDFGGQVAATSAVENYLGFQTINGKELANRFVEQVQHFEVATAKGEKVVELKKEGELFKARMESGTTYSGRTAILSTGKRDRLLNVPGEKELTGRGVAYCATCDAPFFKDKRVVVAGGGNSALTAALDLLKANATVTLVNYAAGWQADEIMMQSARKSGERVRFLDHHQVLSIEGETRVSAVRIKDRESGQEQTIEADGIFVEIGLNPNSEPVRNLAALNSFGELIIDCHCRTNIEGLYGAGDVTTVAQKQIIISAGEGAKAALSAYEYLTQKGLI